MSEVIHFQRDATPFEPFGDQGSGSASIARLVGPQLSRTMGGGVARFDNVSIEWTVLYDELLFTLDGTFTLRVGEHVYETRPGDVLWIPTGTSLRYEGCGATVFYAIAPVDWRERNNLA
ncbi:UNVERIFIED_ORG: ethanolamine utilization protein EutQ [Paraburkholderia sediminicola]|nr:ethanolamine utilization protein EutQ [Paraburkholderia sediminicola]